jgi:hypothetical protein
MRYLNPKSYHWRHTPQGSREWIVLIKAATVLTIFFYGNPSVQGALVELIQRLG